VVSRLLVAFAIELDNVSKYRIQNPMSIEAAGCRS